MYLLEWLRISRNTVAKIHTGKGIKYEEICLWFVFCRRGAKALDLNADSGFGRDEGWYFS